MRSPLGHYLADPPAATANEREVMQRLLAHRFVVQRHGWPDFFVFKKGRVIGVEVKTGADEPTKVQRAAHAMLAAAGVPTVVVRDGDISPLLKMLDAMLRVKRVAQGAGSTAEPTPAPKPPEAPLIYTVPEVCAILSLGKNSVYAAIKRGEIPSIKLGGRIAIPKPAFDQMLAASRGNGNEKA